MRCSSSSPAARSAAHWVNFAGSPASEPRLRPLFFGFPDDRCAWDIDDQFLLGPDILVAPVYRAGARARSVYLPSGARWLDPATGQAYEGGTTLDADAPLERIPVFIREGAPVGHLWN
jgi:alpha-D-xyloside xylohydrolase